MANLAESDPALERPPENELGVLIDMPVVLNRSGDIAIALIATRAYSRGVMFELAIRGRVPSPINLVTYGFGKPQLGGNSAAPFLLGFDWSDGSISSNMPLHRHKGGLHHGGGGGNNRHAGQMLYLDHLPPSGNFEIVTAWPYFDVPEKRVQLDAGPIRDAASLSEPLWDLVDYTRPRNRRSDQERQAQDDAAVLVMPRTGWFGEHFDPTPPPPVLDEDGIERQIRYFAVDADGSRTPLVAQPKGRRLDDE